MQLSDSSNLPSHRRLLFWSLLLTGCVVRILAAQGELWLDEIWNIEAVKGISSPLEIYFGADRLDGHSSLNSVILFVLGSGLSDFLYRLPSLLFSIATLLVIALYYPRPRPERLILLGLVSLSYMLVLYGTEARGYSGMLLCMFLSFAAWSRLHSSSYCKTDIVLFLVGTNFGLLFHYSFIMWYAALLLTDVLLKVGLRPNKTLISCHAANLVFVAVLYILVLSLIPRGTGPRSSYLYTFANAFSISVGGPVISSHTPWLSVVACMAVLLALVLAFHRFIHLFRDEPHLALALLNSLIVCPLGITFVLRPEIVLPRYFLCSTVSWMLIFAGLLAQNSRSLYKLRWLLLLLLYVIGNCRLIAGLVELHRGNYHKVVSMLTPNSAAGEEIIVDHPFRHGMVLDYYFPGKFKIVGARSLVKNPVKARFFLRHSLDPFALAPEHFDLPDGASYDLLATVGSTELSGWTVFIYRARV